MLKLFSEKSGAIRLSEINDYLMEENQEHTIGMQSIIRSDFQAELFNCYFSTDDRITFSEIPWPYNLVFVFGYSVTIFLTPLLKKEIHDRGSHLFHTGSRSFRLHFRKDRKYMIVAIHYSSKFVQQNLEDYAQFIRTRWEEKSPVFYFNSPVIADRETMELLSMLLFPASVEWAEDFMVDELGRNLLMDFIREENHFFQPAYLGARHFESFYDERDELVKHVLKIQPVSGLLKLSGIRQVPLFRKRIHQLYHLNIRGFITERRMSHAMHLLRDPTLSIKEIAAMSGFASAFYFSRVFSDYFGMPPKYFHAKKDL